VRAIAPQSFVAIDIRFADQGCRSGSRGGQAPRPTNASESGRPERPCRSVDSHFTQFRDEDIRMLGSDIQGSSRPFGC
jgi:hypothetical protein